MFILIMYVLTVILIAIVMEDLWELTTEEPIALDCFDKMDSIIVYNLPVEEEFFCSNPVTVMQEMYYDKELAKETLAAIDINMTTDEIIAAISETDEIEDVSFEEIGYQFN